MSCVSHVASPDVARPTVYVPFSCSQCVLRFLPISSSKKRTNYEALRYVMLSILPILIFLVSEHSPQHPVLRHSLPVK